VEHNSHRKNAGAVTKGFLESDIEKKQPLSDEFVKASTLLATVIPLLVTVIPLLATVIPALDNNTQGQAAAGIQ
jgi:hypothetical protein